MSLTRSLLNEFRPIFRMMDEPFYSADPFAVASRQQQQAQESQGETDSNALQSVLNAGRIRSPHVRLSDEADKYVVEAEVPGVRKESLDITIGDNGRSLTIKGNVAASSEDLDSAGASAKAAAPQRDSAPGTSTDVTKADAGQATPRWSSRSSFARTIWLPRPVDSGKVTAKLDHGILELEIPKLQAQTHRVDIA